MLYQKYIPLQEYENSTMKNEYQYLYKKDEGIVEYGNDFLNCEFIHSNDRRNTFHFACCQWYS